MAGVARGAHRAPASAVPARVMALVYVVGQTLLELEWWVLVIEDSGLPVVSWKARLEVGCCCPSFGALALSLLLNL